MSTRWLIGWSVGNAFVGRQRRAGKQLILCIQTCFCLHCYVVTQGNRQASCAQMDLAPRGVSYADHFYKNSAFQFFLILWKLVVSNELHC